MASRSRAIGRPVPVGAGSGLYALAAAAALLAGVFAVGLGETFSGEREVGVVAGAALVTAVGIAPILRLRRDSLDAPGIYALATVLFLGVTSLAWLGSPVDAGPGLTPSDVGRALVLVAAGLAAFSVGAALLGGARERSTTTFAAAAAPARSVLIGAYVASLASALLGIALGVYGYIADVNSTERLLAFGQVFNLLTSAGNLVVLATAIAYFATRNRSFRAPLLVFIALQIALGFYSGVKGTTLEPLIYTALAYAVCRGRFPWRPIAVVAAVTLLFLVPVNTVYRETVRGETGIRPSHALRQALSGAPTNVTPGQAVENSYRYLFTRFRQIDNVALIEARTPSLFPFAGGVEYAQLPAIILVPRALWPSKPKLVAPAEFAHSYWHAADYIRTSTPITQIGDLFRNFGTRGVLIGMFVCGGAIAALTRLYRRWRSPRLDMVYIYSLVYFVVVVESTIPNILATASKSLPFVAALAWLLLPGRRQEPGYRLLFGRSTRIASSQPLK
jgi:hypothetical protein